MSCLGPRHADSYARHMFQLGFTLIWKDGKVTVREALYVTEDKQFVQYRQYLSLSPPGVIKMWGLE